jgi:hypothetical protein
MLPDADRTPISPEPLFWITSELPNNRELVSWPRQTLRASHAKLKRNWGLRSGSFSGF